MARRCESIKRDRNTFSLIVCGCSDKDGGEHMTRAPTPLGQPDSASVTPAPQVCVVPLDNEENGLEFVWETFVDICRDMEDLLWDKARLSGYSPEEDIWEPSEKL